MNTINGFLTAITVALENNIQGLRVDVLAGMEIDPATLRISPPMAFVAFAQGPISEGMSGLDEMDAQVVVLLIEEHGKQGGRQSRAAKLADDIYRFVRRNRWGLEGVGPARVTLIKNMYRPDLERQGLGQFGLSFNQRVIIEDPEVDDFQIPTTVSASFGGDTEIVYES